MKEQLTRRAMLTGTALGAASLAACASSTAVHADGHGKAKGITLKKGATVLLQGDSITDAGRKKDNLEPNSKDALGRGYASLIAYHLLTAYKDKELKLYNRGISGNKVPDLEARWDKDCLDLKPDVLSIMIGVNDYWHTVAFGSKYKGTIESYGEGIKALLGRTKEALPDVQLVICEPFVVRAADGSTRSDWFPEFDQRRVGKCCLTLKQVPIASCFTQPARPAQSPPRRQFLPRSPPASDLAVCFTHATALSCRATGRVPAADATDAGNAQTHDGHRAMAASLTGGKDDRHRAHGYRVV